MVWLAWTRVAAVALAATVFATGAAIGCLAAGSAGVAPSRDFDVVVYGATPSGVMAAVSAARNGQRVLLANMVQRVGGMCSGGLSRTDVGHDPDAIIGGLAHEFFMRNARHYQANATEPQYMLEPHVAQDIFLAMLQEANVTLWTYARVLGVEVSGASRTITSATFTSATCGALMADDAQHVAGPGDVAACSRTPATGRTVIALVFIDASYVGDLMALAGATFTVGREANTTYNESLAGRQYYSPKNQFYVRVNPYDSDGNLLPLMYGGDPGVPGQGDKKVQAYNFRLCVTKDPTNKVPWTKPPAYNASLYELFRRYAQVMPPQLTSFLGGTDPTINGKYDLNNGGPLSTDFIGASWTYPDADAAERQTVWQAHSSYTQGLMWFLASDPSLPEQVRLQMNEYGLCADEFQATGHWPHQLYVREARRMVGDSVFTQHNATSHPSLKDASIGCGAYNFDSHNVQRIPCANNTFHCEPIPASASWAPSIGGAARSTPPGAPFYAMDEGDVEVYPGMFEIPVQVLFPKRSELTNLLVPVCASASHIGFCTLRLEPQFMIMGHSAGTLAAVVINATRALPTHGSAGSVALETGAGGVVVQDVDLAALNKALLNEGQVLVPPSMA